LQKRCSASKTKERHNASRYVHRKLVFPDHCPHSWRVSMAHHGSSSRSTAVTARKTWLVMISNLAFGFADYVISFRTVISYCESSIDVHCAYEVGVVVDSTPYALTILKKKSQPLNVHLTNNYCNISQCILFLFLGSNSKPSIWLCEKTEICPTLTIIAA
jgi:hypothetical protein